MIKQKEIKRNLLIIKIKNNEFKLNDTEIDNNIANKKYTPIKYTDKETKIKNTYKFKSRTKDYI